MKKIFLKVILVTAVTIVMLPALAQKLQKAGSKNNTAAKAAAAPKELPVVAVAVGSASVGDKTIRKADFDSWIKQGLKITDAAKSGTIEGFAFTYAERNFYEDSIGNLMPVVDMLSEYCYGDTLTRAIQASIFERTKPGDTVYFDKIKVRLTDGKEAKGIPLKFAVVK